MAPKKERNGKIRYAVVGLGYISQIAVLPAFKNAQENSELAALVSDDPAKLEKLAKKYHVELTYSYDNYEDCLRSGEIDAVYIALPNHLHRDYTVQAANAGIHVLCEKPMAVTEEECEDMIRAAEENQVRLMIAYRLHFEETNLKTAEMVNSGKLGDVRIFNSVFTMQVVDEDNIRLQSPEKGGGTVYDIGVYCINAARSLFSAEPEEVIAFSANNGEKRFQNCDEMTAALLRFPGERLASFSTSFGASDVSAYQIVGTKGDVRVDPAYEYAGELKQVVTIEGKTEDHTFSKRDQFAPELIYFSDCILQNRSPEPSGREGLADVRVIRAVYKSAETGEPVRLQPFTRAQRPSMHQEIKKRAVKEPELIHADKPSKPED
jgi:predicted dehydrogenase